MFRSRFQCGLRLAFLLCLLSAVTAIKAAVITETITIDGTMTDWTGPGITTNPGQFSTDAEDLCPTSEDRDSYDNGDPDTGTCVGLAGGAGRDLKTFAFTYDQDNLYLYVERFGSSTNVTDWWFYIDTDQDELMTSSDVVYRIKWQGANQNTDREIWSYNPADPAGDPLVNTEGYGDGYDMPGSIGIRQILGSATAGSATGLEMETLLAWSAICGIGCGPQTVAFHIASSNGSNMPNSLVDNMDGPAGGAVVILDLGIEKTTGVTDVIGGDPASFAYTVTATNNGGGDATGVEVTDVLPAALSFSSCTTTAGTCSENAGTVTWTLGSLVEDQTSGNNIETLTVNVTANSLPDASSITVTNTATISNLNESDTDSNNDADSTDVTVHAPPDLSITKTHLDPFTVGINGAYSIIVSNSSAPGTGSHFGTITMTDDLDDSFTYKSASGSGWSCSEAATVITCSNTTTLAAGNPLPALTVIVNPTNDGSYSNTATVTADIYEPNTANNSATDATTVQLAGSTFCYAVNGDNDFTRVDALDPTPGNETVIGATTTAILSVAYDCSNGTVYAATQAGTFGTINAASGTFTSIGTIGSTPGSPSKTINDVRGMAYDATTGSIYVVHEDSGADIMVKINKDDGSIVQNGFGAGTHFVPLGINTVEDITIDPSTGQMYGIDASSNPDQIVTINKTTGATSSLANSLSPINDMVGLSSDGGSGLIGTAASKTSGENLWQIYGTTEASPGLRHSGIGIDNTSTQDYPAIDCIYGCDPLLADLVISKSVSLSTPAIGSNVTYTVTVMNNGPATATDITVDDLLDNDLTLVSSSPSQGTYTAGIGEWYVGTLANGASATLSITATVGGSVGTPIPNTASVAYLTQTDGNASNDSDIINITPVAPDLSTSTKTVTDLNGGSVNPGDVLRYTITLIESGNGQATGVVVQDDTPVNTGGLSLVSRPAGSTDNSASSAFDLEITDIAVPALGSAQVIFDVTVNADAAASSTIGNSATIANPYGAGAAPAAPTLTVVLVGQVKQLYLDDTLGLTRTASSSAVGTSIAPAGSQTWRLTPNLASSLTMDGSSNAGGVSIPIQLIASRGGSGNRSISANLGYETTCGNTGTYTNIGTTGSQTILSGSAGPEPVTLSFNLTSNVTIPSGSCIVLTVDNDTAGGGGKSLDIHPSDSLGDTSRVDGTVFNYINVDSVTISKTPGGPSEAYTNPGDNLYVRAVVSDPFGSYDITSADLLLQDSSFATLCSSSSSIPTSTTAGTATFDFGPCGPLPSSPLGTYTAQVTAREGFENQVDDVAVATIELIALPVLSVNKSAIPAGSVNSGDSILYTIEIENVGGGQATNVILDDDLSPFTSLYADKYGPATPFKFIEGTPASGLTLGNATYSEDDGATYNSLVDSPYDPDVTDWQLEMNGVMTAGGKFTIQYEVKVK